MLLRITGSLTQFYRGTKFDANGNYIRQYVPEIAQAQLPNEYIHQPWLAPSTLLTNLEIKLGQTYLEPIIEHNCARERALRVYKHFRNRR